MGIITGWIFWQVSGDLAGIRSREGALWSAAALQGYLILIFETFRLTLDIKIFHREHKEGVSSAVAFVVSRRLARALLEDFPVPLIYSTLLYFMAGFRPEAHQFLVFFSVNFLLHITAVNVATFCVAVHRNFLISSLVANMVYTIQSMAGGFFVNASNIAIWLRWTKWIAYVVSCTSLSSLGENTDENSSTLSVRYATTSSLATLTTVLSLAHGRSLPRAYSMMVTLFSNL
jgi:hypothetical protein